MLKYMKYELKGTYRFMLAIILAALFATSSLQLYGKNLTNGNNLSEPSVFGGIFIGLMIFVVFGAFIATIFYLIGNFRKDLVGKKITSSLDEKIQRRTLQKFEKGENLEVADNFVIGQSAVLKPITVYGDIIGATIVIGENTIGDIEKSLVEISSIFIGKYLES